MFDGFDGARAHHNVGHARQYGRGQGRNILGVVLVVGIGIDNNVCAQTQACIQPGHKTPCQSLVARMPHNVIHTVFPCNAYGVVGAAIINDEPFHHIKTLYLPRQVFEGYGQGARFVQARYLDD
ncbi:hypothetical protein D3C71_1628330 [compost metagenome]